MSDPNSNQIITFYEFKLLSPEQLLASRDALRAMMRRLEIKGTIILAEEGYNTTVCGVPQAVAEFVSRVESIFHTTLTYKSSFHPDSPFRRIDVKIKPEIVTLKRDVDIGKGVGTHVKPTDWNSLLQDPEVFVLDTRNDYEYKTGTFRNAVNPRTVKFSDLPDYVGANLDPEKHKKVAMFCTGGIRCEKFAPYMKQLGFEEVYQLEGGILRYLEEIPAESSAWTGECFVFDGRVTVDSSLKKGGMPDRSLESIE
jgi:UPF0176 protein